MMTTITREIAQQVRDAARAEWEQWQRIIERLERAGAITKADLLSPSHSDATAGQRLLSDIRYWGDLRARMGYEDRPDGVGHE